MNNYERIKRLSMRELAYFIAKADCHNVCTIADECYGNLGKSFTCISHIVKWLNQSDFSEVWNKKFKEKGVCNTD